MRFLSAFAAALAACNLAGCGAGLIDAEHARRISKERIALLKRQPEPRCDHQTTAKLDQSAKRQSNATPPSRQTELNEALRAQLDYERQCYRHAEMIVRARLTSLQGAVEKAIRRSEGTRLQR